MQISDVDLSWLAGLLEGEGSFMMSKNHVGGKTYYYPLIVVNMTDEDIIQRVANLFGYGVYKLPPNKGDRAHHKQQWRTSVSGAKAAKIMTMLLPQMGVRRSIKIEEILSDYGEIEPTEVRRARSCAESQKARWAMYGTREGKL